MFNAIFCSDCPFTAFLRDTRAMHKSFVRTIDHVRYAAINYNIHNTFSIDDPRYVYFKHVEFYNERNDLNEIAFMSFEQNDGEKWFVTITEYDE